MPALDDIRNQIKIRGFTAGFQDPVSEFKGVFTGFDVEEAKYQGQPTGRNNIVLHFAEVEVVTSSEPYPFPNKDITIGYSERSPSRWTIFSDSLVKFLQEGEEFGSVISRRLHLKIEVHKLFQSKEKGEQPTNCWTVVGVEGAAVNGSGKGTDVISADKQLLVLINGKTEQQFNMEALRLQAVKTDSGLTNRILSRSYFSELTSKGLVQKDEAGIYTLTPAGIGELQK